MTKNELAEKREKAVYHFRNYDSVCCIFDTVKSSGTGCMKQKEKPLKKQK